MPKLPLIQSAHALLRKFGFSEFAETKCVMKELSAGPAVGRTGIYVHAFGDSGEFYVGRAKDIVRRYHQHLRRHKDISHTAIKVCEFSDLSVSEKEAIDAMKVRFELRNKLADWITFSREEIKNLRAAISGGTWLDDTRAFYAGPQRVDNPGQLRRYADTYQAAIDNKYFANGEPERLFARYIRTCIPQPALTETLFWTMGCMTDGLYDDHPGLVALMRLNMAKPEVLSAIIDEKYGSDGLPRLVYMFRVSSDGFDADELARLKSLDVAYLSEPHRGTKQVWHKFFARSAATAHQLLDSNQFRRAAKLNNLKLMQYSAMYANTADAHCLPMTLRLWALPVGECRPPR